MFEQKHVVCLKKDMSCVRRKTCRVFEERHVVCSKKTCRAFEERHVVCSKHDILYDEKSTCHFLANSADRPRIYIETLYKSNVPRDVCLNSSKSGGWVFKATLVAQTGYDGVMI